MFRASRIEGALPADLRKFAPGFASLEEAEVAASRVADESNPEHRRLVERQREEMVRAREAAVERKRRERYRKERPKPGRG